MKMNTFFLRFLAVAGLILIAIILFVGYGSHAFRAHASAAPGKFSRCPSNERPFNYRALLTFSSLEEAPHSYREAVRRLGREGTIERTRDEFGEMTSYVWCDGRTKLVITFENDGVTADLIHGSNRKWFPSNEHELREIESETGADQYSLDMQR